MQGEYIEVDPRTWKHRKDLSVSVGLGTLDKESRAQNIMAIISEQKEHMAMASPMVTYRNLYNSYEKFVDTVGLRNAAQFFDPRAAVDEAPQPPEPPPDPTQALVAAEQIKAQAKITVDQMKAELDQAKAKAQMELDAAKMDLEAQLQLEMERAKHQMTMMQQQLTDDRERDKLNIETAVRMAEIEAKHAVEIEKEEIKADAAVAAAENQPPAGGDK